MSEPPQAPQRRSERKPAEITVTLVIEGDEADQIATAIDQSPHGMRLQTDLSLDPGQHVGLLLGDNPSRVVDARVVWIGKSESTDSPLAGHAGVEFLEPE